VHADAPAPRVRGRADRHAGRCEGEDTRLLRDPGPSHCADCFAYVVRYNGHRASFDDSQARQVPRSVRAVVEELVRISRGRR